MKTCSCPQNVTEVRTLHVNLSPDIKLNISGFVYILNLSLWVLTDYNKQVLISPDIRLCLYLQPWRFLSLPEPCDTRDHRSGHTVREHVHNLILSYNLTTDLTHVISLHWMKQPVWAEGREVSWIKHEPFILRESKEPPPPPALTCVSSPPQTETVYYLNVPLVQQLTCAPCSPEHLQCIHLKHTVFWGFVLGHDKRSCCPPVPLPRASVPLRVILEDNLRGET